MHYPTICLSPIRVPPVLSFNNATPWFENTKDRSRKRIILVQFFFSQQCLHLLYNSSVISTFRRVTITDPIRLAIYHHRQSQQKKQDTEAGGKGIPYIDFSDHSPATELQTHIWPFKPSHTQRREIAHRLILKCSRASGYYQKAPSLSSGIH